MVPRLVSEISSLDAFCDTGAAVVAGIGDSRSWMKNIKQIAQPFLSHFPRYQPRVAPLENENKNRKLNRKVNVAWREI